MQLTNSEQATLDILGDLYRSWKPNPGQVTVGKELFVNKKKTLFIRWGRKGGKTDFIISAIWRHALLNPGSACYYFTPLIKQAREILWASRRIQTFMPKKYIKKTLGNEMRIILHNGSFIKLDGSDNFEAYRGIDVHFAVYDEFKDFDNRFHTSFNPNRAATDAVLIILGTPPVSINEDRNYLQYKALEKECQEDPDSFYLRLPSTNNAENLPQGWLEKERVRLINKGEEYRWKIEYLAEDVPHGKFAVFPMLNEKAHVKPHADLIEAIRRDKKRLEWFCVADPGTATVFGVLFGCLNPYSKEIFILDSIYAKDREETSTGKILPKIHGIMSDLYPESNHEEDWLKLSDEAAAWFVNEALTYFEEDQRLTFNVTDKRSNSKENGISLIKDILTYNMVAISDRCKNEYEGLYWELQHYVADETGKYPKKNDHLIDCFRYFLDDVAYDMTEALDAKKSFKGPLKLQSADDLHEIDLEEDWTAQFD